LGWKLFYDIIGGMPCDLKRACASGSLANNRRLEPTAPYRARVERYERAQAGLLAP
jgi:hypothetical protein